MSQATSGTLKARSKPALKSPLRASTMSLAAPLTPAVPGPSPSGRARSSPELTPRQLRKLQISQYTAWLRTQTNKHKRPFQEQTLVAYTETARALDRWMAEEYIDGDFTACDTAVLNRFSRIIGTRTGRAGRTPGSGTCIPCSSGWRPPTATRTRGPMTSSGTARSSRAPHADKFGSAPAQALFDLIRVTPVGQQPPRRYADYKVDLPGDSELPAGVTFTTIQG